MMCVLLASFALLFSCKKILDPEIIELPTADNAITSSADVEKGVAAAYSFLRTVVPDKVFLMGDVRADVFSSYSQSSNVRIETPIATNTAAALLNNGGGNWNQFYTVIAQCNLLLEKIPLITTYDAALRRRHIGEASFIRALTYFYLVRFWGDVPLNLKSVDTENLSRAKQEDVFNQIKADLDIAITNLELDYGDGDRAVRASKGAAWAIKAHVLGWLQDFAGCEKLCDSVITRGPFSLVTDTTNLLSIFVGKSGEGIFELNFDASLREVQKNRVYNRTLGRPWYTDQSDGGGGTDKFILSPTRQQLNKMFTPGARDGRLFTWFTRETYLQGVNNDRIFLGKYRTLQVKGDTSSQNINESNIIITRLADIMLLRAEALASTAVGRAAEAAVLLNKVRGRAFATPYTGGGDIQDTILLERRKELIGEGQYFFDLVRTRKLDKDSKITAADWYQKGAWLLPIDQGIIAKSNFMITQNEYWK
ncbi:SusD-like starch-binding protein associating with outer membrane [Chitinophaga niastensis]|uniref:SusD-like starch-binding protein associating with outer membrane n=1 Tax=Chitinophaga niastensis TaxID=536980 RepID=A0A2P8HER5_CHINA|nr:RagB/SusD family nutrient uptake outer membrane protein [Chitinophaga niastensis]PSL44710.1 SusD-like starch-binding protein associating with outer membrane [Chitinophaga niastensis]